MSGKNKLIPRLLGVTKDSIVRVDEKTKDVGFVWLLRKFYIWLSLVSRSLAADTCKTMDSITKYIYTCKNKIFKENQILLLFSGFWRLC